jgi:hypothetical protein
MLPDGGGSTRRLTGTSGGTIENYGYDAYGNLIAGGDARADWATRGWGTYQDIYHLKSGTVLKHERKLTSVQTM